MYFKSIDINNYGSISELHYSFRMNSDNNPVPLVLIGENGSGKTLVLSNLVDSLIETKRNAYSDNLPEVLEGKYYKIGSKNYVKNGNNSSSVAITMEHGDKKINYLDIMSMDPDKINEDAFINPMEIKNLESFKDIGYFREVDSALERKDYDDFVILYFPVDRFYIPLWYNDCNYNRIDYSSSNNVHDPKTNIIKTDMLSNIKEWLSEVYLQTEYKTIEIHENMNLPEEFQEKEKIKVLPPVSM